MSIRILQAIVLTACMVLGLVGCGGSGGGGGKPSLTFTTNWAHNGQNLSGVSEKITLFDNQGLIVQSLVLNKNTNSVQGISFTGLAAGTYWVVAELWSLADATGTQTGEVRSFVTIHGPTTFATAVGDNVTAVKVSPTSATLIVQQSQQFVATATNSAQVATFTDVGSITWSTLGGVATVGSTTGLALGTSAGSGSVVATHGPTALQGAATITVNPFNATTTKWTVMVYMNAANNLDQFSTLNVNQMETVASNPQVRFVVQWKQAQDVQPGSTFNGTRRYLVKQDTTNQIASQLVQDLGTGVDMGDKQTLSDFITWAKTFYPAQHYVLVIWNHGKGWERSLHPGEGPTRAVSFDDETGNAIQTWELSQAVGSISPSKFDIIAWDASLMQMMEVDDELRDLADFIAGSEESPPGAGYPYDLVFAKFRDNPDDTPRNLSKAFVDGMIAQYGSTGSKITQSVIDTSQLPALSTAIDTLGTALVNNANSLTGLVPTVRTQAQAYNASTTLVYRDLWDVSDRLQSGTIITPVSDACAAVKLAVTNAVVWEGHNAQSPGSHGIAIDFESHLLYDPPPTGADFGADYHLLRLAVDTSWDDWLSVAP